MNVEIRVTASNRNKVEIQTIPVIEALQTFLSQDLQGSAVFCETFSKELGSSPAINISGNTCDLSSQADDVWIEYRFRKIQAVQMQKSSFIELLDRLRNVFLEWYDIDENVEPAFERSLVTAISK